HHTRRTRCRINRNGGRLKHRDPQVLTISLIVGGLELYFSFGSLTGGGGATVAYRPSAIFLDRAGTDNCKVVALSWDHDTATVAKAVRVSYGPDLAGC
ncbi:MAG: hypothetical protein ACRDTV_14180, partial [Mycobacterium sp.]